MLKELHTERFKILFSGQANIVQAYSERMNSKMRWLWRLLTLIVFLMIVRTFLLPQPKAFIAWPEGRNWEQKLQGEMKQWQRLAQDLPASIEVEVRRLWKDFRPIGDAKEV